MKTFDSFYQTVTANGMRELTYERVKQIAEEYASEHVKREKIEFAIEQLKVFAKNWNINKVNGAFKMEVYKTPDEIVLAQIIELEKLLT